MLNGLSPRHRVEADEDWVVVIKSDPEKIERLYRPQLYYKKTGSWTTKHVKLNAVVYGTSKPFLFANTSLRSVYDFSTNLGKISGDYPHRRFSFTSDRKDTLITTDGIYFIGISNGQVVKFNNGEPDINNNTPPTLDLLKVTLDRGAKGGFFEKISPANLDKSSEISRLHSQVHNLLNQIHFEASEFLKDIDCSLREVTYSVGLYAGFNEDPQIRGEIYNGGQKEEIKHSISGTEPWGDRYHRWFEEKFSRVLDETVGTTEKVDFITSSGVLSDKSISTNGDYFVIKSSDIALLSDQSQELSKYLPQLTETLNAYLPSVSIIPVQKQSSTNSQNHTNQHAQSTGHAPNHGLADMQLVDVLHSISFELSRIADSLENSKR